MRGRYTGTRAAPRYVISGRERVAPELLNIALGAGDEKALPVFSSEMLARGFLRFGDPGPEWRVRESDNDELASFLLGPCMDVMRVVPNPLPEPLAAEDALLNLLDRGSFVSFLLTRRRSRSG